MNGRISFLIYEIQGLNRKLDKVLEWQRLHSNMVTNKNLKKTENKIMVTLEQVLQDTTDESNLDDSIITLLNGVKQQLTDALSGATLPPAVQAQVDQVLTNLEAIKSEVSAAIVANTPAAPAA